MKKKVLILGGSSTIAMSLQKLLLEKNLILHVHYNDNKPLKFANKKNKIKYINANFKNTRTSKILAKFENDYDIIINLVGYIKNETFDRLSVRNFQDSVLINSLLPFLIIKKSLDHMKKNKWGRIVNTSSIGVKFGGGNQTFNYSISKHINEFIPKFIRDLYKYNILYNVIRIGLTNTKIHSKIKNKIMRERINMIPIKKIGKPNEIADFINYIVDDKNTFITGQILDISGGE